MTARRVLSMSKLLHPLSEQGCYPPAAPPSSARITRQNSQPLSGRFPAAFQP